MPWYCGAVGCNNRQGKCGKRFYKFPADKRQRQAWIRAVKRKDWTPSKQSRICSGHFVSGKSHEQQILYGFFDVTLKYVFSMYVNTPKTV